MDIDTPRGRSASSSTNSSRVLSAHSDLSSIPYHERMEVQSNKLTWDEQVDLNEREDFSLSYASPKVGENKPANEATDHTPKDGEQRSNIKVSTPNNTPIPQGEGAAINNMNTCTPRYLETTTIPYEDNQPVELNSWDGEAYPLSIFRTIEFLDTDSKNILTSLLRMANFIRNRKLKNNTENDIPALEGFGQAAWSFILPSMKQGGIH